MKKNQFLTFCCALVPGCGQMYQGYMRRGFSLMFWFCAFIGVSAFIRIGYILVVLPVIWAYSFFDTFNIRSLSPQQRAAFADNYLPASLFQDGGRAVRLMESARGGKVLGIGLIAVGAIILYNTLWDNLYWAIYQYAPTLANWINRLPALAVGVAVILLGIWMLSSRKKTPPDDDIDFGGGEPRA
ncbi:MAG: hypothetical protein AB7V55_02365 [Oscillospiraceae bacterium]